MNHPVTRDLAIQLEHRRRDAMLNGDIGALGMLLSPQLYYRHSTGTLDSRDSLLARISGGELKYRELGFQVGGHSGSADALVVHGEMSAQVLREGEVRKVHACYLACWMLTDTWQLVAFQGLASRQ